MNADVMRAVLASIPFLAAFLAVGGRVLQWAGVIGRSGDALRFLPIAMASGFAVYSYVAYPIVGFGSSPAVVWAALLGGVVVGRSYIAAVVSEVRAVLPRAGRLATPAPLAFLVASIGFLLLASTFWFTPPREGDALYGYMFNARWLYMQGFVLSPYNTVYNLYPFNTELVFALGFAIGNEIVAKVLDGVMGLVLLAAVYQTARSWASTRVSFFAAASLAVMNAFTTTWASGKIDVLCTLTFFAAVSLLILHREVRTRVLVVAAFLVGTSCAQKYTVWLFAVVFVAALPLLLPQPLRWRERIRHMAIVGVVIFACLLPHFTKTVSWTGNPVAPFGGARFGSTTYLNPVDYSDAQTMSLADVPALPYLLFFSDSVRSWPGPFPFLLLIGLPALAFVRVPVIRRVALFAALLVGVWIAARGDQWLVARFLLIPTALLLVVAAAGVSSLSQRSNLFRMAVTGLMLGLIVYSGIWQNRDWRRSWSYILGYEDRATWNDRVAPGRAYGALQALSKLLGPERRFLLDASLYYIPPEKLPYTRTEREAMEFWALPESKQLEYLQKHCFGFLHIFGPVSDNPAWTDDLKVFAQLREPSGGTEYTIFEIDTHCGRSTAVMSAALHAEQ